MLTVRQLTTGVNDKFVQQKKEVNLFISTDHQEGSYLVL